MYMWQDSHSIQLHRQTHTHTEWVVCRISCLRGKSNGKTAKMKRKQIKHKSFYVFPTKYILFMYVI